MSIATKCTCGHSTNSYCNPRVLVCMNRLPLPVLEDEGDIYDAVMQYRKDHPGSVKLEPKDTLEYWKERCLAAEKLIGSDQALLHYTDEYHNWSKLKNKQS